VNQSDQDDELKKAAYIAATFQQTKPDPENKKEKSLGYQILITIFVVGGIILACLLVQALGKADGSY
jgi:hypothetical protein